MQVARGEYTLYWPKPAIYTVLMVYEDIASLVGANLLQYCKWYLYISIFIFHTVQQSHVFNHTVSNEVNEFIFSDNVLTPECIFKQKLTICRSK